MEVKRKQKNITPHQTHLVKEILHYMKENKTADITQASTASVFHITPQYLARLLKQNTGKTFRQLMEPTEYAPCVYSTDNAERTTISAGNQRDFSKASICSVDNVLTNPAFKSIRPITVDFELGHSVPPFWQHLINLGYATELINRNIEGQIKSVKEDVGFRYGRICAILDTVIQYPLNGRELYDYSDTFYLLDLMEKHQMIPFLEIGNKQFFIQETMAAPITSTNAIDSKSYFEKSLHILPFFLKACINRYGEEKMSAWCFEISFPYTDFDGKEHFTFVNYLNYFKKLMEIIHRFLPDAKVGGPGFNDWDDQTDQKKIDHILQMFHSHRCTPDFITAYNYSLTHDTNHVLSIAENPDTFASRINNLCYAVHQQYPDMEVWLTEFNSNLSSRNYMNDSCYQAAFLTKSLLGAIKSGIYAMGYYLLSDAPLRYVDTLDFLFGGWGLFTDTNIPKPSYHVFSMFRTLGTNILKNSANYLITANSPGSYQLLFYHYEHPNSYYRSNNVEKQTLHQHSDIFMQTAPNVYQLELRDTLSGTYLIKDYILNENSGNLFHEWEKIDYLNPNRQYEQEDLRRLSSMLPRLSTIQVTAVDSLKLEITTQGNEVRLILIEWYA